MSSVIMTYKKFSHSKFPLPPTFNQNLLVSFQSVVLRFIQNLFRCVHKRVKSAYYLHPICPYICMEQLESHRADFHEIWYLTIFPKSVKKVQVSLKSDVNKHTFHEDQYTFLIISHSIILRMRNVSDKSCRKNQNTHFIFKNSFPKIMLVMR